MTEQRTYYLSRSQKPLPWKPAAFLWEQNCSHERIHPARLSDTPQRQCQGKVVLDWSASYTNSHRRVLRMTVAKNGSSQSGKIAAITVHPAPNPFNSQLPRLFCVTGVSIYRNFDFKCMEICLLQSHAQTFLGAGAQSTRKGHTPVTYL